MAAEKKKGVNKVAACTLILCAVGLQLFCAHVDLPLTRLVRNAVSSAKPGAIAPKYECAAGEIAKKLTVVVTVKDACSQMPQERGQVRFMTATTSARGCRTGRHE